MTTIQVIGVMITHHLRRFPAGQCRFSASAQLQGWRVVYLPEQNTLCSWCDLSHSVTSTIWLHNEHGYLGFTAVAIPNIPSLQTYKKWRKELSDIHNATVASKTLHNRWKGYSCTRLNDAINSFYHAHLPRKLQNYYQNLARRKMAGVPPMWEKNECQQFFANDLRLTHDDLYYIP